MTRLSWLSLCSVIVAAIGAPAALAQLLSPTGAALTVTAGYFDPNFREQWRRQHLGVDLEAPVGSNVVAPVEGDIVISEMRTNAMSSYVVIRTGEGVEHVLGHISSPLAVGTHVAAGQVIGTVMAPPSNSPLSGRNGVSVVHWGVNRVGVEQSLGADWEWDRAPGSASRQQAERRGWVGP